jgi:hypothetical protein
MNNYREFQVMERFGSPRNITLLYAQWWEAVKTLSLEQQQLISQYVGELHKQRPSFIGLRRLSVRLNIAPFYSFLMAAVRHIRRRLSGKPVYASALEAARQTDCMASLGRPL